MFEFTVSKPCSMVFDVDKEPLKICFDNGKEYHSRDINGKVSVNFPIKENYKSNYKPVSVSNIHKQYDSNFKTMPINIVQGEFISPVAMIDITAKKITVCRGFFNLNYQYQVCILEHEKAHLIAKENEQLADKIAAKNYLKLGFNQSQFLDCLQKFAPKSHDRHLQYFSGVKKNK